MNHFQELDSTGFVLLKKWLPNLSTEAVAKIFGRPIDIGQLLPTSNIPCVQMLTPKPVYLAHPNRYSSTFGLEDFPLHTDLSHWFHPPRYFLLRCLQGSPRVFTHILTADTLAVNIGQKLLRNAVLLPSRRIPSVPYCPLPMVFFRKGIMGIRWDQLFLKPFNDAAATVADAILNKQWKGSIKSVALVDYGDTLVIDNWRILHGRSSVDKKSTNRKIERIYLSATEG